MTQSLNKRIIDLLGGYPAWASDDLNKSKIEVFANRLFELGEQYQGVMIDAGTTKTAIPLFIGELLEALNSENSVTLKPAIEKYHLNDEFLRVLKLADLIRKGDDVPKELKLTVRNINMSKRGNQSKDRPQPPDYQSIVNEANALKRKDPRLNTSKIALHLTELYPEYSAGRIRNILSPLKK